MKILKYQNKSDARPDTGRRSFIWKTGAAMTALLATAVPGMSKSLTAKDKELKNNAGELQRQLQILQDQKAIRELHHTYETCLDRGMYEDAVDLFTEDGEAVFNGGIFRGRKSGLSRLYLNHFRSGLTGKTIETAPGFSQDIDRDQDSITVAPDRMSAIAKFPYSIQAGMPMTPESQLVKMAQLHGEGIMKWWEGGICEVSYVKEIRDGDWKIKSLNYHLQARTNYRPGKSHSEHISIPVFKRVYPYDKAGPDKLV